MGANESRIWLRRPATEFNDGLPVGAGRLTAMVLGDPKEARVALNHEWLWRGVNRGREPEKSAHLLPRVRELLLAGRYEEGNIAGNDAFAGGVAILRSTRPNRVDPYQPAGDLRIALAHGEARDYLRELDLDRAAATVSYEADGVRFTREVLAHMAHDLILV